MERALFRPLFVALHDGYDYFSNQSMRMYAYDDDYAYDLFIGWRAGLYSVLRRREGEQVVGKCKQGIWLSYVQLLRTLL